MTSRPAPDGPVASAGSASTLPRAVLVLVGSAAAVVLAAGLRSASGLIAPIVLALILTIAVAPLSGWARRHGWPSWAAGVLAMLAVYAIVAVLVVGVALSVVKLAELLPQYAPSAGQLRSDVQGALRRAGVQDTQAESALDQIDLGKVTGRLTGLVSGVLGLLGNLFFLVTVLFFFCAEAAGFGRKIAAVGRDKPELATALTRYATGVRRYLVVTAVFGAIVAVLDTSAVWLLGIPLPLLWGLFSFLTNFVPNIGFVLGVIPPALIALLDRGWGSMLAVLAVYSVLNLVIQTIIQPRFVGESVGLSTTVAFLSLAVWAFLLGPLGALLAVPMTLLVRALFLDPDPTARWTAALISSTPPAALTPPARVAPVLEQPVPDQAARPSSWLEPI
ncbi:MAG TPA: AI-2E family transporter [Mycobacteriales bacterium]